MEKPPTKGEYSIFNMYVLSSTIGIAKIRFIDYIRLVSYIPFDTCWLIQNGILLKSKL